MENSQEVKIVFFNGDEAIWKMGLLKGRQQVVSIGKSRENADVPIPESIISRRHAQLTYDLQGDLFIQDLNSTNGTYVNGKRIDPGKLFRVAASDQVYFAGNPRLGMAVNPPEGKFKSLSDTGEIVIQQTDIIDKFQTKNVINIGRSPECDVVINHPTISRKHASIEKLEDGTFRLKDLESMNGTYLNGKKISGSVKIGEEDVVLIGRYRFGLRGRARDLSKEIAIRAERIVKQYPNGHVALKETSFQIPSKSLLAIMGPSGCGKSTLMKALNGDSPPSKGKVYLFNLELISNYEFLKTQIGYVPQDDIVHRELTVEQSLYFAAKLRLDNPSDEAIKGKIDRALNDLNIAHIRHNRVGKISGGQRKRVSIAVELLTDPLVLFLDEPTSPLDPQTIEEFLGILRRLAQRGTTVVMVTHKPEDLNFMDSVVFMAEGGVVYFGETTKYKDYFGVQTSVEVYANITGERAKTWLEKYHQTNPGEEGASQSNPETKKNADVSFVSQFTWLTARYVRIKTNDKVNTMIMIGQAPIIALLVCFVFSDVTQAVPFLMAISAIWFGANNAAREVVGELPVYKRERMFNLRILPYLLSKVTVLGIFSAIQSALFTLIVTLNYAGGNPSWHNVGGTFLWMLGLSVSATLMGLFLSSVVDTAEKVMTLVPIVLIPQIMLAGIIAKITNPMVEIISYITLSRWGTEGFCALQKIVSTEKPVMSSEAPKFDGLGNAVMPKLALQRDTTDAVHALNSQFHHTYADLFGKSAGTLRLDILAVALISLIFFSLTYLALKKKDTIHEK